MGMSSWVLVRKLDAQSAARDAPKPAVLLLFLGIFLLLSCYFRVAKRHVLASFSNRITGSPPNQRAQIPTSSYKSGNLSPAAVSNAEEDARTSHSCEGGAGLLKKQIQEAGAANFLARRTLSDGGMSWFSMPEVRPKLVPIS
jgi:hypothetical protein